MSQKTFTAHQNIVNMRSLGEFDAIAHTWFWISQPFLQWGKRLKMWSCTRKGGRVCSCEWIVAITWCNFNCYRVASYWMSRESVFLKKLKWQASVYNINKNFVHKSISEFERHDSSLLSAHVPKMLSSSVSSSGENVLVKKNVHRCHEHKCKCLFLWTSAWDPVVIP